MKTCNSTANLNRLEFPAIVSEYASFAYAYCTLVWAGGQLAEPVLMKLLPVFPGLLPFLLDAEVSLGSCGGVAIAR